MYGLRWKAVPYATACPDEYHIWIDETKRLLSRTRQFIRKVARRLGREGASTNLLHNQAATVHRMLQDDAIPSQLYSVVKETGDLTASASDMQKTIAKHFEQVFAIPKGRPSQLPYPPPPILQEKETIQHEWYDSLIKEPDEQELLDVLQSIQLINAPGHDLVSSGVWKIVLQGSDVARKLVISLFSACVRSATFPSSWKIGIIVPLVKDATKE